MNANPNIEMKKIGMVHSNTPVCEQTFSWLNKYRNIKTMNESHFKLFILYILDLHNLHIENKVDILANPLNPNRQKEVSKLIEDVALDGLFEGIEKISLDPSSILEVKDVTEKEESNSGYSELPSGEFACSFCPGTFKRLGNVKNHLEKKHGTTLEFICGCGKSFKDSTTFTRHQKSCKH